MEDQDYTLSVLKMVINTDLDKSVSTSLKDLDALQSNRDQLVWEIATKIYARSGHKVELPMVRDLIDSRIRDIKNQFTIEKPVPEYAQKKAQITTQKVDSTRVIFIKICSVICKCTDVSVNRVSMDSCINDLADKQEFSQILMNLEKDFDIQIPDQAVRDMQTVKHAVDFINTSIKVRNNHSRNKELYALLAQ